MSDYPAFVYVVLRPDADAEVLECAFAPEDLDAATVGVHELRSVVARTFVETPVAVSPVEQYVHEDGCLPEASHG